MPSALLGSSFVDEARLRSHLFRTGGAEDDIDDRLVWACNRSIAWMETRTTRRLKARNYRTQVTTTTSGSTAAQSASIDVASTASLKVGDDVLCAGLDVGTQVESITDGNTFVPSRRTLATIATGSTLTCGSGPLFLDVEDGDESDTMYVPESPLLAVNLYGLYWVGPDGVRTAVSLTYARYDESVGSLRLLDMGRFGAGRYEFECRAGYEQPSATALGHPTDWEALTAIQLRVAEVYFTDDAQMRGRASTLTVGPMSLTGSDAMPADVEHALRPYWRRTP